MKKIVLTIEESEILNNLAESTGMDCWFQATEDGRIKDLESGKFVSVRNAVTTMVQGIDLNDLGEYELKMILEILTR